MSDFWAGYISGAASILIGNPLDLLKTRLQAGALSPLCLSPSPPNAPPTTTTTTTTTTTLTSSTPPQQPLHPQRPFDRLSALARGATAPILGYGLLNAILFASYNRTLLLLGDDPAAPVSLPKVWGAGAVGGLATFVVSAPTELVKCRVQVMGSAGVGSGTRAGGGVAVGGSGSSWGVAREIWGREGVRGLYFGGGITSVRDAVGYGFYFWSYELCKQVMSSPGQTERQEALKVLLCGGLAGIVTWASIFPLDVIKTRVQTQPWGSVQPTSEQAPLIGGRNSTGGFRRLGAVEVARQAYQEEGLAVFFRGLGVCSIRAFIVNAVQWAVYEWMMQLMNRDRVLDRPDSVPVYETAAS